MLTFNNWINLTEAVSFDPSANYPDKTFGFAIGSIDSGKANMGGVGGDWDGSMPRALAFGKTANDFVGKNTVTSQKRSRVKTASGKVSDHYEGSEDSYAVDIAARGEKGDALLAHLMQWCGHPEYKGGSWFNFNSGGYRYQIGWDVPGHTKHIHVGVRKSGTAGSSTSSTQVKKASEIQVIPGKTPGERILNNQAILNWLYQMMPDIAPTLTPEALDLTLKNNPEHFQWFKDKFNLNSDGNPIGSPDLTKSADDAKEAVDAALSSKKIKSNYTGEKAKNIDLLIEEMNNQGVTNKYAIIGILSTIGKESGFIPQNEIGYGETPNKNIRKIFGSRVKDLSDTELDKLKANTPAFFDKIYGMTATDDLGWNTGNDQPGDGYKYRGRGFNQITFKANYKKYGDSIGMDLVSNPDQLNDVKTAAKAAVTFIINGLKRAGVDPNSFTSRRTAIRDCVKVNAGGSSASGDAIAKAEAIDKNFDLA